MDLIKEYSKMIFRTTPSVGTFNSMGLNQVFKFGDEDRTLGWNTFRYCPSSLTVSTNQIEK